MSIKWFSLTVAAMSLFFFMFLVSAAMAQDGYLVYQGPTDSQSYGKVYKKASRSVKVKKTAKAYRNAPVTTTGDSLYDRPEYPAYVDRRFAENPMGYSGYVTENGQPAGRLSSQERLARGENPGFESAHIGQRSAIMPDESGDNAQFLASVTPGYMKTRHMDVIGPDLYVWESGIDVPKRYQLEYQPNNRVTIRDMQGNRAGSGVIDGRTGGLKGTLNVLNDAENTPLRINRYLTSNITWDVAGNK